MTSLTIFVDANQYKTGRELHLALKRLLDLPEYYGCNADALYDCLSERHEVPRVIVLSEGVPGESAEDMKKCLTVFEDCGCEIITK